MPQDEVKVWDLFVRAFHWILVFTFTIAYLTEDEWMTLHVYAGYTVLGLILLRLVWGLVGTHYARFSEFVYTPDQIRSFVKDTARLRARRYLGHNPAGGAMIVLMLVNLLLTAMSGIAVYGVEEGAGPMSWLSGSSAIAEKVLEGMHEILASFMLLLILVHVGGVLIESVIHRENLVRSMLTGRKKALSE